MSVFLGNVVSTRCAAIVNHSAIVNLLGVANVLCIVFLVRQGPLGEIANASDGLSDPRNRNHKSLAIGNHNFEVASFSRRNRSKIAVSQSQKSHWAKKIAAIQTHTLVVETL